MFIVCGLNPTITPPPPTNPPGRGLAYYLTPAWLILIKNHVVIKCFKYSPFYHVSFQPYNACFNFRFTYPWEETELWNIERVRVLTEIVSAVYIVALLLRSMTTLIQFDNGLRQAFRCSRGSTQKPCRVRERERQEHTSCRTIKICIEDQFKPDWRYVRWGAYKSTLHQRRLCDELLLYRLSRSLWWRSTCRILTNEHMRTQIKL